MIIFQIIIALAVLSLLILVHEFGHYLAARLSGIWVEEFGIGYPPKVWSIKIGETQYSINALPIGGFVKLHGETGSGNVKYPDRAFVNKSPLARIFVAMAGVVMNFVLAIMAFSVIFWFIGVITEDIKVIEIAPNSPASEINLMAGDIITSISETKPDDMSDFMLAIQKSLDKEVSITILREGEVIEDTILLRENPPEGEGAMGVTVEPANIDQYFPALWKRPFVYTYLGFERTVEMSGMIAKGLASMISNATSGEVPKGVAGPIGIGGIIAEFSKQGILPLIELIGIISINLAILNIIPFPPLDGSRIVFVILESVIGKKKTNKIENRTLAVGMGILILLMVIVTISEIPKIISAGSLSAFVETLLQ